MKSEKFRVQSYDGGKEYTFFNRTPFSIRADIALESDGKYKKLNALNKQTVKAIAMCIFSAEKVGLGAELGTPDKVTVDTCLAFSEDYCIQLDMDSEIGGGDFDENPTDTQVEAS